MKQGYNDRMDDSLGNRDGKKSSKEQNYKDRRDEAKAMNKAEGKRAYQSVDTMDKKSFDKTWAKFKADTKKAFGGDKYAKGGEISVGDKIKAFISDGDGGHHIERVVKEIRQVDGKKQYVVNFGGNNRYFIMEDEIKSQYAKGGGVENYEHKRIKDFKDFNISLEKK